MLADPACVASTSNCSLLFAIAETGKVLRYITVLAFFWTPTTPSLLTQAELLPHPSSIWYNCVDTLDRYLGLYTTCPAMNAKLLTCEFALYKQTQFYRRTLVRVLSRLASVSSESHGRAITLSFLNLSVLLGPSTRDGCFLPNIPECHNSFLIFLEPHLCQNETLLGLDFRTFLLELIRTKTVQTLYCGLKLMNSIPVCKLIYCYFII